MRTTNVDHYTHILPTTIPNRKGALMRNARSRLFGSDYKKHNHQHDNFQTQILQEQTEDILEHETNKHINALKTGISTLKEIGITIGDEIKASSDLLDIMASDMRKTRGSLQRTMSKLNRMIKSATGGHMCWLILFIMVVFFVLYWMIKFSRR